MLMLSNFPHRESRTIKAVHAAPALRAAAGALLRTPVSHPSAALHHSLCAASGCPAGTVACCTGRTAGQVACHKHAAALGVDLSAADVPVRHSVRHAQALQQCTTYNVTTSADGKEVDAVTATRTEDRTRLGAELRTPSAFVSTRQMRIASVSVGGEHRPKPWVLEPPFKCLAARCQMHLCCLCCHVCASW